MRKPVPYLLDVRVRDLHRWYVRITPRGRLLFGQNFEGEPTEAQIIEAINRVYPDTAYPDDDTKDYEWNDVEWVPRPGPTFTWDAGQLKWVEDPTLIEAERVALLKHKMLNLELNQQPRAAREALLTGDTTRLRQVDAAIANLRSQLPPGV